MFAARVPTYSIDLGNDEAKRWAEVISREKTIAGRVVQEAATAFERVPELLRWVFARLYVAFEGLYRTEIESWADALTLGTATMLNCAYELSHLRWPKVFGCTAGVRWIDGLGMVHVRTLDWPLATMGGATRLFRFHRGAREAAVRKMTGPVVVQANHHVAEQFVKNNEELREIEEGEEEFSIEGSGRRADTLAEALTEIRSPCTSKPTRSWTTASSPSREQVGSAGRRSKIRRSC